MSTTLRSLKNLFWDNKNPNGFRSDFNFQKTVHLPSTIPTEAVLRQVAPLKLPRGTCPGLLMAAAVKP